MYFEINGSSKTYKDCEVKAVITGREYFGGSSAKGELCGRECLLRTVERWVPRRTYDSGIGRGEHVS